MNEHEWKQLACELNNERLRTPAAEPQWKALAEGLDRTDFLEEIKQPAKAEEIGGYCDRWWVAAGDEKIVRDGELPGGWGLLVVRGSKLVCAREAPKREPRPLDREFIAAILRKVSKLSVIDETGRLKELRTAVTMFEHASGISLTGKWQHDERVGNAVRIVLDSQSDFNRERLSRLQSSAEAVVETIKALREAAHESIDIVPARAPR